VVTILPTLGVQNIPLIPALYALLYLLNLMCCTFAEKCAENSDDVEVEDKPCTRCGKSNQPEWVCAVTCVMLTVSNVMVTDGFVDL